jgi:release factor glutamine methyltransferase
MNAAELKTSNGVSLPPGITLGAARRAISRSFRDAGLDSPDLDARLIAGHALGLDHAGIAASAKHVLDREKIDRIAALAARRLAREPLARILGQKEFWSLTLEIAPSVLVPRPETETVVEAAIAIVEAANMRERSLRIADLGTGSGAILLALLSELKNATGIGTDLDPSALATARANAMRLGLHARSQFICCNFGTALTGGFNLVVSNPPYVVTADLPGLQPEVRDYDPRLALDGGVDGLQAYRAIAADARRLLAPGGHIVVELGAGQAAGVAALFANSGLTIYERVRCDLAGHPRALSAQFNP